MIEDEHNAFYWLIQGLLAALLAIVGFFTKGVIEDVNKMKESDAKCALDLANFKTDVANNYVKESTLSRIHDRIDTMQDDIKQILQKVGTL